MRRLIRKYSSSRRRTSFTTFSFSAAAAASLSLSSLSASASSSSSSFFFVSSFSAAAIVVAFDVAVLSNALESFVTKGGGKDSFDLFICIPFPTTSSGGRLENKLAEDGKLEALVLKSILDYRAVLQTNCSEILPPLAEDYSQILYLMMPDNKSVIKDTLVQISQFYQMIKRTFYNSSPVGKLLWMPLFLVVWPDLEDYYRNDTTTEKLIRASFHQPRDSISSDDAGGRGGRPPLNNNNKDNIINNIKKSKRKNAAKDNKKSGKEDVDDKGVFFPLSQQSFSVNSDVYFYFGRECEEKRDNVWEVYSLSLQPAKSAEIIVQKLTPDRIQHESMFEGILGRVRRRGDLRETKIRAVASKDPSSFLEDPSPGTFDPLSIINGTPTIVFNELEQGLNFTTEIIIGDWIRKHPNGTLKGNTASLFRRGLADMTISLASLLPYRKVELSFLQPTYSDSVNGFFVQPAASSFRDIVISPFSFGLWLSLLITYLIIVASVLGFGVAYRKMYAIKRRSTWRRTSAEEEEDMQVLMLDQHTKLPQNDSTFRDEVIMWAVGAVTQQGWHISPHSNSIRVAFILGNFLGLVCYGAFSAAVTSILAVELIPIKTRSDLLDSSLTFYADDASSTMAYIVNYLKDNTKITFGHPVNLEQGVDKLKQSKEEPSCYLAFPQYFYLSALAINISHSWICDQLSVIPVTTVDTPSSMVVPRNSEYAELFNFLILKMLGRGLNRRFVQLYHEVTTLKCTKGQIFHPLGYGDLLTAFLIVSMGVISAIVVLLLERIFAYFNKKRDGPRKRESLTGGVTMTAENRAVVTYGGWMF